MTNYRRNFLAGGSFFFTVNLAERRLRLLTEYIVLLRHAFREVRCRHPFEIEAIVVLPDHLHAIWTLPQGDADFALRWRLIKSSFRTLCRLASKFRRAEPESKNAASGSAAIGNTRCATKRTLRGMPITFISIRSSMDMSGKCGIGRIRPSIAW